MTETLKGKTVGEARELFDRFHAMITSDPSVPADDMGKLSRAGRCPRISHPREVREPRMAHDEGGRGARRRRPRVDRMTPPQLPMMTTGGLPEDSPANAVERVDGRHLAGPGEDGRTAPARDRGAQEGVRPGDPGQHLRDGPHLRRAGRRRRPRRREDDADGPRVSGRTVAAHRSPRQDARRCGRVRRQGRSRVGPALDERSHVGRGEARTRNVLEGLRS